jgi:signal transduction histidine kinase
VNVHSTGYGLFIAKQIVEAHGGAIRAESAGPGEGSTFTAEFPIS